MVCLLAATSTHEQIFNHPSVDRRSSGNRYVHNITIITFCVRIRYIYVYSIRECWRSQPPPSLHHLSGRGEAAATVHQAPAQSPSLSASVSLRGRSCLCIRNRSLYESCPQSAIITGDLVPRARGTGQEPGARWLLQG